MIDVIECYDFLQYVSESRKKALSKDELARYNETQRQVYKADLLSQLDQLDKEGLEIVTDNLLNKGVRILDADVLAQNPEEAARMKQAVIKRNSYQLIIKTSAESFPRQVENCKLAFYDPSSNENMGYREFVLSEDEFPFHRALALYFSLHSANDDHGCNLQHMINRDEDVLCLVKNALCARGIATQITKRMDKFDYRSLQAFLKTSAGNDLGLSRSQELEKWHVLVSAELRHVPDFIYRILSSMPESTASDDIDEEELMAHVEQEEPMPLNDNVFCNPAYPRSRFLGHKFYLPRSAPFIEEYQFLGYRSHPPRARWYICLQSFVTVGREKYATLKAALQGNLCQTSMRRSPSVS